MKKRLLSAALALAMVLTLLPATAFAVTYSTPGTSTPDNVVKSTVTNADGTTTTHKYFEPIYNAQNQITGYNTVTVSRCTTPGDGTGREFGSWYWLDNKDSQNYQYHKITSGIITGNGGSGQWYPSLNEFYTTTTTTNAATGTTTTTYALRNTTFTVLGTTVNMASVSGGTWTSTSLNVDLEGSNPSLTVPSNIVSLTVTSKFDKVGTVNGFSSIDRSAYPAAGQPTPSAVTLNATNVNVGTINLKGRGNGVTLTDCTATAVTMDGETKTAYNTSTGVYTTSYLGQRFTATGTTITGDITIKGDSSTVSLTSVNGGTSATAVGDVSIEGHGGTLTIAGASNVGDVTAKSRAANATQTTISNIPSITVTGGKVASISTTGDAGNGSANITLNRTTGNTNVGAVSVNKGSVSVAAGVTTANITVPEGSVTITGNTLTNAAIGTGATTGTLTLGANGAVNLSVSGYGSDITGITVPAGKGDNLNIRSWPVGRNNNFGTLSLQDYAKKQITGGTFSAATKTALSNPNNMDWVDNANLQFIVPVKNPAGSTDVALYGRDELTEAISSIAATTAATKSDAIILLGQGDAATKKYIQINFGGNPWVYIEYTATTGIKLPTRINNTTIGKWIVNNGSTLDTGASFTPGVTENIPYLSANGVILDTTETQAEATKIVNVYNSRSNSNVNGNNVRVRLNGNNIEVSGAVVPGPGGTASITVDLLTDVVDVEGNPVIVEGVMIDWDVNTKKVSFNAADVSLRGLGAIVQDGVLILNRGTGARYTVSGNLAVSAPNLNLLTTSTEIKATVGGKLSGWREESKQDLIDQIEGGSFDINDNLAVLEAINAAQATITNRDSVTNWIATARSNVWTRGFVSPDAANNTAPGGYAVHTPDGGSAGQMTPHSGTYANAAGADKDAITDAFTKAWLVPYLQVNVTDYDESGTMTATLIPSYRVDISGADYDPDMAYTVQAGRTLGELTGDMATKPVKVKFNMTETAFETAEMHQDGKYVYTGTAADGWQIYHAGTNGLGTVEINNVAAPITMTSTIEKRWTATGTGTQTCPFAYDDLQAAVDDTKAGVTQANSDDNSDTMVTETFDTITVAGDYAKSGKSCDFTMTGIARKVVIKALGDLPIRCTSQNVDKLDPSGYTYTFQLKRDVVAVGTVLLAAQPTNQGTVSLPVTSAKVGQTVTVTVVPNVAGQTAKGVTVKTNDGTLVPATATDKVNEFSFVVPKNTTSITVTPNFAVTTATFAVNNTSQGTALANTGTADNTAQQGSTVPVTVYPNSGYRTVGLTVRTNTGATVMPTRTGDNAYSVTVPAGATIVTVTPSFDYNTGTRFEDVLSTHWASKYVTWAYQNNYIQGTGTYTYSPNNYMTLGEVVEMLYKAAGSPSVAGMSNPFTNLTPTSHWAYNACIWAYHQGLISGGTINPWGYATRAEIVQILYRRAGSPAVYGTSGFADVANNASYARAVTWARQKGLTNGYGGKTYFRPGYALSRAEMATFLGRAFGNMT